jgi:SPP1 family phage portal protein
VRSAKKDIYALFLFLWRFNVKKGIPQIKIPIRPSELTIEAVEPYIDSIFSQFEANAIKIRKDYEIYCLDHPILSKVRAHQDTDINNIVLVPDLKAMVDWKTGYTYGNPIKYAQSKTNETDDINYLNKYVRSACQRAVDKEVGKWAFATGVGYYFIEPKSTDFDIENEAPYVLYHKKSDSCTKVYSAFGNNEPLFDIIYTTYKAIQDGHEKEIKVIDVYFSSVLYTYEKPYGAFSWELKNTQSRGFAKPLPLTEKRFNSDGIGIVAMGATLQNAVDRLLSNGLDNVEDIVNEIFVYKNVNLGATPEEQAQNHQKMKKSGALVLSGGSKDNPPDVGTISTKLSLSEVRELFALIDAKFHSSLGVPMEMSNTNSGGTTKSGSEVANGYDNAYNRALDDINTMIVADTDLLNKIMWICKNTKGNKINNLAPSEIEIKYSLNLTDNILTKTQSYVNLVQVGVPHTIALRLCKLSNDPEAEGKIIEEYARMRVDSTTVAKTDEGSAV